MFSNKPHANGLADEASQAADEAIRSTRRLASEALDGLALSVPDIRHQGAPMLHRANEQAIALARRGVDAVRDGSQHVRDAARRASDGTAGYIRDEPFRSIVFAALAGAALAALAGWASRHRDRS